MSDTIRHVTVRGRVQGVGYRYFVEYEARARGLEGWVRNRRDGSVEALFSGPAEAVAAMIAACRRGPPSARVEALRDEAANPDMLKLREAGERFSVLPTV
jgi:acylphosphatase